MFKKSLSYLTVFLIAFNISGMNESVVFASTAETAVVGSVTPTLIKVSAPARIAFSIDPNIVDPDKRFNSSKIKLINESNAAVKIKIKAGSENFMLSEISPWKPVNMLPNAFTWNDLGTTESQSYIALGIKPDTGNWKNVIRQDPLYVVEQNISTADIVFGEIDRNSDANMQLVCFHGSSFAESKECSFKIVWSFSIGD